MRVNDLHFEKLTKGLFDIKLTGSGQQFQMIRFVSQFAKPIKWPTWLAITIPRAYSIHSMRVGDSKIWWICPKKKSDALQSRYHLSLCLPPFIHITSKQSSLRLDRRHFLKLRHQPPPIASVDLLHMCFFVFFFFFSKNNFSDGVFCIYVCRTKS